MWRSWVLLPLFVFSQPESLGCVYFKFSVCLGLKLGFTIDRGTLHNVSLGQGQEEIAETVVKNASKLGHWVILQVGCLSIQ